MNREKRRSSAKSKVGTLAKEMQMMKIEAGLAATEKAVRKMCVTFATTMMRRGMSPKDIGEILSDSLALLTEVTNNNESIEDLERVVDAYVRDEKIEEEK